MTKAGEKAPKKSRGALQNANPAKRRAKESCGVEKAKARRRYISDIGRRLVAAFSRPAFMTELFTRLRAVSPLLRHARRTGRRPAAGSESVFVEFQVYEAAIPAGSRGLFIATTLQGVRGSMVRDLAAAAEGVRGFGVRCLAVYADKVVTIPGAPTEAASRRAAGHYADGLEYVAVPRRASCPACGAARPPHEAFLLDPASVRVYLSSAATVTRGPDNDTYLAFRLAFDAAFWFAEGARSVHIGSRRVAWRCPRCRRLLEGE